WDARSKFLYYKPRTVILTSCEYDHFNEFPTEEDYVRPYREFVGLIPENGLLVACEDGARVMEVAEEARCRVVTYSGLADSAAEYRCSEPRFEGAITRFSLLKRGRQVVELETRLFGEHNLQNIAGASAALLETG